MKGEGWKIIAGLLVVAVVAVGLGLLLRGQRPAPEVAQTVETATATDTAAPTTTPEPTATEVATQAVEATPTPAPTATPLPPAATPGPRHLSAAVEVPVPAGFLRLMGLEGDTAVILIKIDGKTQIATWSLVTGQVKQISDATGNIRYSTPLSHRWVVWGEEFLLDNGALVTQLKAYNREDEQELEIQLEPLTRRINLSLSDNWVVWQEWGGRENRWDIFAYDLERGTKIEIAARSGIQSYPRISGDWVAYLDWSRDPEGLEEQGAVDVRAHNLKNGEDFLLDQACYEGDESSVYVVSDGKVVWTKCTLAETGWEYQLLGVDLNGPRGEYFVTLVESFFLKGLFGDILSHRVGSGMGLYDLGRKEPIATVDALRVNVGGLFISGSRVVWEKSTIKGVEGLYTASIKQ